MPERLGSRQIEDIVRKGLDGSPPELAAEMIAMCREHFPAGDWRAADMRTLSLDQTFDGIIAWDSFFHLSHDDQRNVFPIFRQHAAQHAALMFTSGPSHGIAIGSYRDEALFHASLDPAEYRELLAASGFDVVRFVPDDPACHRHTIWLAQRR